MASWRRKRIGMFTAALLLTVGLPVVVFQKAASAAPASPNRTISVTITDINCGSACDGEGIEGPGQGTPDWYAKVFMNSDGGQRQDGPDDTAHLTPNWVFNKEIPLNQQTMPVRIQLWDRDSGFGGTDDLADDSKRGGEKSLDFNVDAKNKTVTSVFPQDGNGKIGDEICTFGNGDDGDGSATICYKVGDGDRDGDGLQDTWETNGIDFDGDGNVDLALNAAPFNANPDRKDIFMEIDYMSCAAGGCAAGDSHSHRPAPGALQDVVNAFANASTVTNPDGSTGITLHAMEDEAIPEINQVLFQSNGPGPNDDFNDIKNGSPATACGTNNGHFGTVAERAASNCAAILGAKRLMFQYAVFGHDFTEQPGSSGNSELSPLGGNDLMVTFGTFGATAGAIAAAGGQQAADASTLMHELGHNLSLTHGGLSDGKNCKPNYLSIMNYALQFPNFDPTRPMNYSTAALPTLDETALPASGGVGGPAGRNTVYGIGGNVQPPAPANGPINWDGAGGTKGDINYITRINPGCNTASPNDTNMQGYDDWRNLVYDHSFSTGFADGASRPGEIELTGQQIVDETPIADLNETKTVDKPIAQPGDTLNYTVTTNNAGPGKAYSVNVTDTPPTGAPQSRAVGELALGASNTQAFSYAIACSVADGTVLTNSATVTGTNVALVNDPNTADNTATASTTVQTPKVQLTKSANASANAGTAITYNLTYNNTGAAPASNVVIKDIVPNEVYYSLALDQGAGPKPNTVVRNSNGTTTLTWNIGNVAATSTPVTISYTARPSLLMLGGTTVTNSATVSFTNGNGCAYSSAAPATFTSTVTTPTITGTPLGLGYWRNHSAEWTPEILARIQATDQHFDGADGSAPDGKLSPAEVQAAFAPPGGFPQVAKWHILAGYFNLATGRMTASSPTKGGTAKQLGITNVRGVGLYSIATLSMPYNDSLKARYNDTKNLWSDIQGE